MIKIIGYRSVNGIMHFDYFHNENGAWAQCYNSNLRVNRIHHINFEHIFLGLEALEKVSKGEFFFKNLEWTLEFFEQIVNIINSLIKECSRFCKKVKTSVARIESNARFVEIEFHNGSCFRWTYKEGVGGVMMKLDSLALDNRLLNERLSFKEINTLIEKTLKLYKQDSNENSKS